MSPNAKANGALAAGYIPEIVDHDRGYYRDGSDGLTKRETFALAAMQGMFANPALTERSDFCPEIAGRAACAAADALLVALEAA